MDLFAKSTFMSPKCSSMLSSSSLNENKPILFLEFAFRMSLMFYRTAARLMVRTWLKVFFLLNYYLTYSIIAFVLYIEDWNTTEKSSWELQLSSYLMSSQGCLGMRQRTIEHMRYKTSSFVKLRDKSTPFLNRGKQTVCSLRTNQATLLNTDGNYSPYYLISWSNYFLGMILALPKRLKQEILLNSDNFSMISPLFSNSSAISCRSSLMLAQLGKNLMVLKVGSSTTVSDDSLMPLIHLHPILLFYDNIQKQSLDSAHILMSNLAFWGRPLHLVLHWLHLPPTYLHPLVLSQRRPRFYHHLYS